MPQIKAYLQLVRVPNLFTAAADSLAGWLLVTGSFQHPFRWIGLMVASMAIYAGGVALNDVCDFQVDLRERPNRPLPSGRVSVRVASGLAACILVLGTALALLATGRAQGAVTVVLLVLCVIGYNTTFKHTIIGPILMGACRCLNLLLGASVASFWGGHTMWIVAMSYGVFVAGVTWISRGETERGKPRGVMFGLALQNLAFVGIVIGAGSGFSSPGRTEALAVIPIEGLFVLSFVALGVNLAGSRAILDPCPATIQAAVKTGILSLVWINAAVVLAVIGLGPGLAVAALWLPSFVLGKWVYST